VPETSAFADLRAFTSLRRITGLALAAAGDRLVAVVQEPDEKGARYSSALWEVPLGGGAPIRLTRSDRGEGSPAFLPSGELLFTSERGSDADGPGLWSLPPVGEAQLLVQSPGGLHDPVVASAAGTVVVSGARLTWGQDASADAAADAAARADRSDRKITAILHTGMPIRHWDAELGDTSPRLFVVDGDGLRDLAPDAGQALHQATCSLAADGTILLAQWRQQRPGGRFEQTVVRIDVRTGKRSVVAAEPGWHFIAPRISPDGRRLAVIRSDDGRFDRALTERLQLRDLDGGEPRELDLGELHPREWAWATDSGTVYVSGDLHGRGAVLAVDAATGRVSERLAVDASYSNLCPAPDGSVYALRSAVDEAPVPVRLESAADDQRPGRLPTPAPTPQLPGTLTEFSAPVDGVEVHGWLCRPHGVDRPPVMLWVHGGPFSSWNSWSWRWNPWVAVAHGWAVVLPDPALSTGYGPGFIERAWPHRAAVVWRDLEAVLDHTLARFELDHDRVACLGASFGGYLTNWIAGHTDRFGAIVTHAGLWALDQQHTTTDGAQWKTGVFGTPEQHPQWYAENSPHHFVDRIRTPMLISHGNRDYRVPISEALRLWWDLLSRFPGDPEQLPHRFLQLTGENHWVLSPANSQIWYETVLAFCDRHCASGRG
jgi:dipeptidyl aminopeptidase/acylaminoacyl peptidase